MFLRILQIPIKEEHKDCIGFAVPSGHYEFNRLPFGLSNNPANFHRLMDVVLKDPVGSDCNVFMEDTVVLFSTAEKHALRLEYILERFDRANLQLHPGKCEIAKNECKVYWLCLI
jgi:hypothetical protein